MFENVLPRRCFHCKFPQIFQTATPRNKKKMFIAIFLSFFVTYFANYIYSNCQTQSSIKNLRCRFSWKWLTVLSPEAYLEHSKTYKMDPFCAFLAVNYFHKKLYLRCQILNTPLELLTIFAKSFILNVWLSFEYVSG